MELRQLIEDEDGVSPVIGVILMVAITVILAAVIGTFVLGLGDQVQNTAPSASFTFDYESTSGSESGNLDDNSGDADGPLDITHDGGPEIPAKRLTIQDAEGNSVAGTTAWTVTDVSAGDTATVNVDNDDTIRVTWTASGGGKTATLGKWTGPQA